MINYCDEETELARNLETIFYLEKAIMSETYHAWPVNDCHSTSANVLWVHSTNNLGLGQYTELND